MKKEKELDIIIENANATAKEKADKIKKEFSRKLYNLAHDRKDIENENFEVMAAKLGISHQTLINYTNNKRFPQLEQLILIKELFEGVDSFDFLLSESPYEVSDKNGSLTQLGLSGKAVANLKKICKYSNDWGFDEQQEEINPIIFALNYLLENGNELLYLIGDYLLFPKLDNETSNSKDDSNSFVDEDVYIKLYQYKIVCALERFINDYRYSKKDKNSNNLRSGRFENILFKINSFDNYSKYTDEHLSKELQETYKEEN
jgi:transcriptional regulator with XRE-family HTH domain